MYDYHTGKFLSDIEYIVSSWLFATTQDEKNIVKEQIQTYEWSYELFESTAKGHRWWHDSMIELKF
jgi:hypothetical protein